MNTETTTAGSEEDGAARLLSALTELRDTAEREESPTATHAYDVALRLATNFLAAHTGSEREAGLDRLSKIALTVFRSPRTYSGGNVTLRADIFDDMMEAALEAPPTGTTPDPSIPERPAEPLRPAAAALDRHFALLIETGQMCDGLCEPARNFRAALAQQSTPESRDE